MISIRNLCAKYNKKGKNILKGISFNLERGKVMVLVGPNGAGKSTIIKSIIGIIKNTSGEIIFDDIDISKINNKRKSQLIAYVPQNIDYGSLCVYDTILLGRLPFFTIDAKEEDYQKVNEVIEEFKLTSFINKNVNELSGGEKQKVAIARAIVQDPQLLIFDEPTSNLDIANSLEFLKIIKKLAKEKNIAVLIAIHDLNLALNVGDEFIFIKDGKIACQGNKMIFEENIIKNIFEIDCKIIEVQNKKVVLYGEK